MESEKEVADMAHCRTEDGEILQSATKDNGRRDNTQQWERNCARVYGGYPWDGVLTSLLTDVKAAV
jgi:hypothetical protein